MPVKNEEEDYEKIVDMSNNNDYTTGNLLDFAYFKKHYKLMAIDFNQQTKLKDPQQINFVAKFENQDHGPTIFFHYRKIRRNYFSLFTKFCYSYINNGDIKDCEFIKWF